MPPLTPENLRRHPPLREQLVQAAHRRRNAEIGALLARLAHALTPRSPAPRPLPMSCG